MENLYFDTNIYRTGNAIQDFSQPQLQPAFVSGDDDSQGFFEFPEIAEVDLQANQEFLNMIFLQNQFMQLQQASQDNQAITPTDDFFGAFQSQQISAHFQQLQAQEQQQQRQQRQQQRQSTDVETPYAAESTAWFNSASNVEIPQQNSYFDIKSPFALSQDIQQSTIIRSRSAGAVIEDNKSLSQVAFSKSMHRRSNPFYGNGDYLDKLSLSPSVLPKQQLYRAPRPELRRNKRSSDSIIRSASPKINDNFIREYQNKKISKFIKGTKKTNQGYKNFINYKFTGDNFERDS